MFLVGFGSSFHPRSRDIRGFSRETNPRFKLRGVGGHFSGVWALSRHFIDLQPSEATVDAKGYGGGWPGSSTKPGTSRFRLRQEEHEREAKGMREKGV